ncbi:MAG: prephenate dehydratase [Erysipelotrichaceae bacterium]|nr:prephenate dehydratase [Erysipelotrichaceae bacterium]
MLVGYQGVQGSYSEVAVIRYFGERDYTEMQYVGFPAMIQDVAYGKLDYAVFPVENTTTGLISRTYDLFQHYDIHVIGEVNIPIHHHLIGLPGAGLQDIREVYSHPEALSQCQAFLDANPQIKPVVYEDTALAVRYISGQNDLSKAALASRRAAEFYEMKVICESVYDNAANMTRFLIVTAKDETVADGNKISIMLTLPHVPGALYNALGIFASKNINVVKLESRPIRGKVFEYCFYIDFSGNLSEPDVAEALRRLEYDSLDLKIFGNYREAERTV